MKRCHAALAFLLWIGFVLGIYYVVQRPGLVNAFAGLVNTFWTCLVAALLLFNSYCIGRSILFGLGLSSIDEVDRLLLGTGTGLGGLGLLGLVISAAQVARTPVFFFLLLGLTIFFILSKNAGQLQTDLRAFATYWNLSFSQYGFFTKIILTLLVMFSFLLTLAPQFEAFDALLYHLAQPARVLQDGGLRLVNVPHFWFPNLTENVYLWTLALGSEGAAQMIHWAWGMLSALLMWRWAAKVWDLEIGRKVLLLLASIASLPMLASWAYADLALVFYAIAALYALTNFGSSSSPGWLRAAGVMAGLAMTIKYTSFTLPLTCGLLILFWGRKSLSRAIVHAAQFGFIALIAASPWYVRNAVMMGNPFYPFAFGGQFWDAFRAEWYASPGSGIGWDALQIVMLPLSTVLGHRDQNFFDGRLGPLFLLLAPFALWILFSGARESSKRGLSLQTIGLFSAVSFAAWTFGVISTQSLWQARLLLPALVPFAVPTALGWDALKTFDSSSFRISFLCNVLIAVVIALTVFDNAVFVLQRNPLAVAVGAQSRAGYIARVNPSYAALMQAVNQLPANARLYNLFEPRSYGLPRPTQPDPINDNFFHDLHVFRTPDAILQHWKEQGYTHIIVYERGMELMTHDFSNEIIAAGVSDLHATLQRLELVNQTPDRSYSIYRIP